jgi:hypothetical protein
MSQQTAVDSLWDSLTCLFFFQDGLPVEAMERYNQAKQMEEEQHHNTWLDSRIENSDGYGYLGKEKTFEQYYNETYNTN